MKASTLLRQYVWIVDTIGRAGRITLRDLNARYQLSSFSEGQSLNRKTFNRHREAIAEVFGLTIACDAEYKYYIADRTTMLGDSVPRWMVNTLSVSNIVGEARNLHGRLLLESIPSETEYLSQVVEAMQQSVRLNISYRRYGTDEVQQWTVDPYCIKLTHRRWYLLGHMSEGWFITLSFDRMLDVVPTTETFKMDDGFDAASYFSDYFGVMTDARVPMQRIVLRAFDNERFYLRDLPLHHSQKAIAECDNYTDYELLLRPTSEFVAHLLSRGRWVKVLQPAELAQQVRQMHLDAAAEYAADLAPTD